MSRLRSFTIRLLLASSFMVHMAHAQPLSAPEEMDTQYATLADQAMEAYRKGQSTQAITLMQKAYKLVPTNTAILNNLAASYIQRGVYYHNTQKNYAKALEDYRHALFYLEHDWPESVPATPTRNQNIAIIKENLEVAMKGSGITPSDWKKHLQLATDLRKQGRLPDAMIEYAYATQYNNKLPEAWIGRGDIMMVRQKPGKALEAYTKALDSLAQAGDTTLVKLGTAYIKAEQPQRAVEILNQALLANNKNKDAQLALETIWNNEIKINPRNMSAHLNLGAAYQQMGRFTDAYAQYQIADRLSPGNPITQLNMGSLLQAQGQLDGALQVYNRVLQQNPAQTQALLYKAEVLKKMGRGLEAEQLFVTALAQAKDKRPILDELMVLYKTKGNPAQIKSGWQQYTSTYPKDAPVWYQAGLALHELKDYDGAIRYYQQAVQLNPQFAEAYANLGTALHAIGNDDAAIAALKQAQTLNPNVADVSDLISGIQKGQGNKRYAEAAKLHQAGKLQEAVQAYEAAISDSPQNSDIVLQYGLALQQLKQYDKARSAYDKAITLNPNDANAYYYKGTLLDEQNQLSQAQSLYQKALQLNPQLTEAQQALHNVQAANTDSQLQDALDAYNNKDYAKTLSMSDAVLKADPNNAMAYYYKGLAYDAQQKLDSAKMAYQKAMQLDGSLSDALYALAVVLDTQGKTAEAKKTYQQFLQQTTGQPEDDFIRYAKERFTALK